MGRDAVAADQRRPVKDPRPLIAGIRRHLDIVEAQWSRALEAADEGTDGLKGTSYDGGPSGSGEVSRPTERAALRARGSQARRLERELSALSRGAQSLALLVTRLAPPSARNLPDGSVVVDCGNAYRCPTNGRARREGRCSACWDFLHRHGRDRTVDDVEAQKRAAAGAAAARKREARARDAQPG